MTPAKIGVCGCHGSGKTCEVNRLEDLTKRIGKTVFVVREVARNCPHTLGTIQAQEWIYHHQMEQEKCAMKFNVDIIYTDRTILDNLIYYYVVIEDLIGLDEHMGMWHRWSDLYREAIEWIPTYAHVIRMPLNLEWLQAEDDIRPKSMEYVRKIDRLFDQFVDPFVTQWGNDE